MVRDGFRCVVTGDYDVSSVKRSRELEKAQEVENAGLCPTECAHIFAESTNANISGSNEGGNKRHYAAGVWAVMARFGYKNLPGDLNGNKIHRLENVLTLDKSVHDFFDTLELWFEPVKGIPNTYTLHAPRSGYIKAYWKRTVTFTTPDSVKLPVPSPEYLAIHATCCKVAYLSGAGEYIERILREMEDTKVLSQDGASAEALQYALLPLSSLVQAH